MAQEFEIKIFVDGHVAERKGHSTFVQTCVNKFGSNVYIRPMGSFIDFKEAAFFNFKQTKVYKNVAAARRRLMETFKLPTMFEQAQNNEYKEDI